MRIALGIEYDGRHFCGWQMQTQGMRTVQAELENALSKVADKPIQVICAGRTDTGVHARSEERRVGKECRTRGSTYD